MAPGKQTRVEGGAAVGTERSEARAAGGVQGERGALRAGDWEADDGLMGAMGLGPTAPAAVASTVNAAAPPEKKKAKSVKHKATYLELGERRYSIVGGQLMAGGEALGEIEDAAKVIGKLKRSAPTAIPFAPAEGVTSPAAGDLLAGAADGAKVTVGDKVWVRSERAWTSFKGSKSKGNGQFMGFAKYGGGTVRERLTEMTRAGKLRLSGEQIAAMAAAAEVETGGQIGCVQTYDDQVVSVGFKQVVMGHGSLEEVMEAAPAGFAKHGLVLDASKRYEKEGWRKQPRQIVGCEDVEELRSTEWALRFYHASMEPDVVAAISALMMEDLREVAQATASVAAGGGDPNHFFDDLVAKSWLLEVDNNRPAFMPKAVQRAKAAAASARTRDEFLDQLAAAIVETYVVEEPLIAYRKAKAKYKKRNREEMSAEADAELLAKMQRKYEPIGRKKGTNIVTKIARTLTPADVGGGATASAATATATVSGGATTAAKGGSGGTTAASGGRSAGGGAGSSWEAPPRKGAAGGADHDDDDAVSGEDVALAMLATFAGTAGAVAGSLGWMVGYDGEVSATEKGTSGGGATTAAQGGASGATTGQTGQTTGATTGPTPPKAPAPPPAVSALGDAEIERMVAQLADPAVTTIARELAGIATRSRTMKRSRNEEQGEARDQLVADFGALRQRLAALPARTAEVTAFKAAVYRKLQELAPYYFQSRNIDILETSSKTRTCNVTVLGMALESLGKNPSMFTGHRDGVLAAARVYQNQILGKEAVGEDKGVNPAEDMTAGRGTSWAQLLGMRFPDFIELAAISREAGGATDDESIKAAAVKAWNSILDWSMLGKLASDFGANAKIEMFDASGIKKNRKKKTRADHQFIRGHGDKHRDPVEDYINARIRAQEPGKQQAKNQAAAEKLRGKYEEAIADEGIDERVSLDTYRDHLVEVVGRDLDGGKAVIVGLAGHFVKLQSLDEEKIVVDDPGRDTRSATVLTYAEARAMGYFHMRFVVS